MENGLVGTSEIAGMLAVSKQRVTALTARPDFPKPVAKLAMGKVWKLSDVVEWANATDRAIDPSRVHS